MSKPIAIKLSTEVLKWARKSIGYSIEESAKKLAVKPEKIESWEKGLTTPTYAQLEGLAYKVYKRPLAVFFLPSPPQEKPIEQDFRNLTSSDVKNLSSELRLVVRKAKHLQNLIFELNKDDLVEPKYKEFKVSLKDNAITSANRFRQFINLSIEEQKKWQPDKAFDNFKALVESIGIYVFHFKMPFEEARAFSLTNHFPVIVLNSVDAKNGRIFSLFHEVCHILFNVGDIFRDKETGHLKNEYTRIEDFCNTFAAEFLVPEYLFKKDIDFSNQSLHEWSESDLEMLSKTYKVSKEVVLRKLVELRLATKQFYFAKKYAWDTELRKRREKQNKKAKEEGRPVIISPTTTVVHEKGKMYINNVLEGYNKGKLTYSEISDYLDVKVDHLPKILERISK
jgi:Zn-dependent peptidase ImmA (M78 family)/DNA-binding XRE family transcriptional regulator